MRNKKGVTETNEKQLWKRKFYCQMQKWYGCFSFVECNEYWISIDFFLANQECKTENENEKIENENLSCFYYESHDN